MRTSIPPARPRPCISGKTIRARPSTAWEPVPWYRNCAKAAFPSSRNRTTLPPSSSSVSTRKTPRKRSAIPASCWEKDVAYLATNPDLVCPVSFGFIPDCGSMSIMLKNATGKEPFFIRKAPAHHGGLRAEKYGMRKGRRRHRRRPSLYRYRHRRKRRRGYHLRPFRRSLHGRYPEMGRRTHLDLSGCEGDRQKAPAQRLTFPFPVRTPPFSSTRRTDIWPGRPVR